MDAETERVVNRLEEKLDKRFDRLEAKLDAQGAAIGDHEVKLATVIQSSDRAHVRINTHARAHEEGRKWWATLWGGVAVLAIKAMWDFLKGGR